MEVDEQEPAPSLPREKVEESARLVITLQSDKSVEDIRKMFLSLLREDTARLIEEHMDRQLRSADEDGAVVLETCFCCFPARNETYWCDCNGGTCWFQFKGCIA